MTAGSRRKVPTKKVPSDPVGNPLPGQHARPEHVMQRGGSLFLRSPQPSFCCPATVQRSRIRSPDHPLEANASKRSFARPQRLFPFENHRGEVDAPALFLRRSSKLFFQPVRPPAPVLCHALHAAGDDRSSKPVAVSQAQNFQTSIQLSLPFGTGIPLDQQRSVGGSI